VLNDAAPQLSGIVIQLAILAVVSGFGTAAAVIGWFIRRDIKLAETARAEHLRLAESARIEQGLKYASLEQKFEEHVRRTGFETKDIQYRMGIMATQVKHEIPAVDIPEWPSR
jgi:hypothetical protein